MYMIEEYEDQNLNLDLYYYQYFFRLLCAALDRLKYAL